MTGKNKLRNTLFVLYCIVMGYLLFARSEAPAGIPYADQLLMRVNLKPLETLRLQLRLLTATDRPWLIRHAAVNLLGNVILFIPLGLFLPGLCPPPPRLWKVLATAAGIILLVEALQVLTLLGRCDIDDLILNLLGTVLGYCLHRRLSAPDRT